LELADFLRVKSLELVLYIFTLISSDSKNEITLPLDFLTNLRFKLNVLQGISR